MFILVKYCILKCLHSNMLICFFNLFLALGITVSDDNEVQKGLTNLVIQYYEEEILRFISTNLFYQNLYRQRTIY